MTEWISRRAVLQGGAAALLLGGCSSVVGPVSLELYTLRPAIVPMSGLPKVAWQLSVGVPEAPEGINTERIALTRADGRLDYFAGASWVDRVPSLLQSLIVQSFEDTGAIVAVARDTAALRADYFLATEIRSFEAVYGGSGPPVIVVRLHAKLVRMPERDIVAGFDVEHRTAAVSNSMASVVAAYDEAAGAVLGQVIEWTLKAPPSA